jgi:hypothetical protein
VSDPKGRRALAVVLLVLSLIGWGATHVLMLITDPPENTWVFHILLAISWFAITMTAFDLFQTSDVRSEQEDDDAA